MTREAHAASVATSGSPLLALAGLIHGGRTSHLPSAFEREVAAIAVGTPSSEIVEERSVAQLPAPVGDYMRFMGVVGQPRDASLRASFSALFRRSPGAWLPCEVLQYDQRLPIARVFMMRLSLGGLLPVIVRDNYLNGHGTLRAKAFDVLSVAEGHGSELDVGELVTYLNDAILMAPSLLLGPETTWSAVDARTFDVQLTDGPTSVKARVWLDERGAPVTFSTRDRFFDAPGGKRVRTEWRTPIEGWQKVGARQLPTRAHAVWMLPTGPFAYADFTFDPTRIAFNVPPS